MPSRLPSPALTSDRQPIRPAQSSGAACRSSYASGKAKQKRASATTLVGIATVDLVAGEARLRAEILPAGATVRADPARPAEPRDADAAAHGKAFDARPAGQHTRHDLMAGDQRQLGLAELAVDHVQVGAADRAGHHARQDLARSRGAVGQRAANERLARFLKHHREHRHHRPGNGCRSSMPVDAGMTSAKSKRQEGLISICLPWVGALTALAISSVSTPFANRAETALRSASTGSVKDRAKLP